jgi:hypothetical protein
MREHAPDAGEAAPEDRLVARISAIRGDFEECADRFQAQIAAPEDSSAEQKRETELKLDWVQQTARLERRAALTRGLVMALLLLGLLVGSTSLTYNLAIQPWLRVSYFADDSGNRDPLVLQEGYLVKTPKGTVLVGVVTQTWAKWDRKLRVRAVKWLIQSYSDRELVEILLRDKHGEILARWTDGKLRFARRKA